jgi:hypothetical protein
MKSQKEVTKAEGIKVFFTIFCLMTKWIRILEVQKHESDGSGFATLRKIIKRIHTSGVGWRRPRVVAMPVETPIMPRAFFRERFSAYYFLKVHLHHFSKIISQKEVTKAVGIKVFLAIFA